MDNIGYLFAVFGIIWIVLFVYVFASVNKQNKLQKEIQSLKEMLADKGLDKTDS